MTEPLFADPRWFDPQPGGEGVLGMTLEELYDVIRAVLPRNDGATWHAENAIEEIARRIDASLGNT